MQTLELRTPAPMAAGLYNENSEVQANMNQVRGERERRLVEKRGNGGRHAKARF